MENIRLNLILFVCLCTINYHFCYPSGAPLERCGSMMPGHNVDPIRDPSPFRIDIKPVETHVNHTGHRAQSSYYVSLFSDQVKFKGFLLEARGKWNGKSIGQWSTQVPHTKTIDCFGNPESAITHYYDDDFRGEKKGFTNVTVQWTAPLNKKLNRVKFIATVVQSFSKIYMNVSASIMLKSAIVKPSFLLEHV